MKKDEIFMLWIGDKLPELQILSLKSLLLTGHKVKVFVYQKYPELLKFSDYENLQIMDANEILSKDQIWHYNISEFGKGSVSGFANLWRLIYLERNGGTWVDFDVLAIRNLQEFIPNMDIVIGSEWAGTLKRGTQRPNNNLLSFPSNDPFVKHMKEIALEIGQNAKHAETGPKLLNKLIKSKEWSLYQRGIVDYQVVGPVIYTQSGKFIRDTPAQILQEQMIDINKVYGFHIWNTYFTVNTKTDLFAKIKDDSIFSEMKNAILSSSSQDEYYEKIAKLFPLFNSSIKLKTNLF